MQNAVMSFWTIKQYNISVDKINKFKICLQKGGEAMEEIEYSDEQNRLFAACIYSRVIEASRAQPMARAAEEETEEKSA